jgi:hypothetical protein
MNFRKISEKHFIYLLIMEKLKEAIVRFLIILISLCFVDGGRSFLITGSSIQILLAGDHTKDIEIPHQQHLVNFTEDEKLLGSSVIDFSFLHVNSLLFLFPLISFPQEFLDSIWQPPKNV